MSMYLKQAIPGCARMHPKPIVPQKSPAFLEKNAGSREFNSLFLRPGTLAKRAQSPLRSRCGTSKDSPCRGLPRHLGHFVVLDVGLRVGRFTKFSRRRHRTPAFVITDFRRDGVASTKTNEAGNFTQRFLIDGRYRVGVEARSLSFTTLVRIALLMEVRSRELKWLKRGEGFPPIQTGDRDCL